MGVWYARCRVCRLMTRYLLLDVDTLTKIPLLIAKQVAIQELQTDGSTDIGD